MRLITDQKFENFETIIKFVKSESEHQLRKWGVQERTPAEWLMFLGEEFGELCEAVAEYEYRNGTQSEVLKEAAQTATLALKILEMYLGAPICKNEPAEPAVVSAPPQQGAGADSTRSLKPTAEISWVKEAFGMVINIQPNHDYREMWRNRLKSVLYELARKAV